jgi:D-sedoheptulose 7-phosphate isomerase
MSKHAGSAKSYLDKLVRSIESLDLNQIDEAVTVVWEAWQRGAQIITLGNGGSAMTALHMVTDWNKFVYLTTGKQFRGRSLVDNVGLLMAYANDMSFENVFVEQLKGVLQPGDLVLAISGSGNSENVIRAVQYANENQAVTLGLCGFDGGRLAKTAQHVLHANVADMQLCEDVHSIFGHLVMQKLVTE